MSARRHLLRRGVYRDSLVLMQLQHALERQPGVAEAAAMMATPSNREILAAGDLWPDELEGGDTPPRPDDLLVVVRADDGAAAEAALGKVEELLARRSEAVPSAYRYRGLEAALADHPDVRWVAVSVPGEHAAAVAEQALDAGRNVFLYSDNVALDDEVRLKRRAGRDGLLLLGPDCGTAAVAGVGLGFCNRWRRGRVGLVGASGTGLQAVGCGLDARGVGVSHCLGTGGRDLATEVGARTTLQAFDLLDRDPGTAAIVLVSKPPAPAVAGRVMARALTARKPVVLCLLGGAVRVPELGPVHPAATLDEAVERVAGLAVESDDAAPPGPPLTGHLRGLFAGGTLATEVALGLRGWLHPLATNLGLPGTEPLADPERPDGHAVIDLGADELTVGRPHPMIDPAPRDARLRRAAADPSVGLVLLDVVLGNGAHPDPAAGLAPAVEEALTAAREAGRELEVVALVVGTGGDPQGTVEQADRLEVAGARVVRSVGEMVRYAAGRALHRDPQHDVEQVEHSQEEDHPVPPSALETPGVVNVGLEAFAAALADQGAMVAHVDWRPPAGGDRRLGSILERMKGKA